MASKRKPFTLVSLIQRIVYAALGACLCVMVVFLGFLVAPTFIDVHPYVVITGSMEPTITPGTLVYIDESQEKSSYQPGQIIAFNEEGFDYPIVHRVQSVGDGFYITKGDANTGTETVPFSDVLGDQVWKFPYFGTVVIKAMDYKGMFIGFTVVVCVLSFVVRQMGGEQTQQKRQPQQQKQSKDKK